MIWPVSWSLEANEIPQNSCHLYLVGVFSFYKGFLELSQVLKGSLKVLKRDQKQSIIIVNIPCVILLDYVLVLVDNFHIEAFVNGSGKQVDQVKLQILLFQLAWVLDQVEHYFGWWGLVIQLEIRLGQKHLVLRLVLLLSQSVQVRNWFLILTNEVQVIHVQRLDGLLGRCILEKDFQVIEHVNFQGADDQALLVLLIIRKLFEQNLRVLVHFIMVVLLDCLVKTFNGLFCVEAHCPVVFINAWS